VAYIERKGVSVVKDLTVTVTQCADGTALCVFGTEYVAICALRFKVTWKNIAVYRNYGTAVRMFALQSMETPTQCSARPFPFY